MANSNMVNSLIKAIDILSTVAKSDDGIRLNELADGLGMRKTTVHNLVRTLRARNYLIKDKTNRFQIGPAVHELLHLQNGRQIIRLAEAEIKELHKRWPMATLTFSEHRNGEILCRLRMSADQPGFMQHPVSLTLPPYTSATSLVLMALDTDYRSVAEERFSFESYAIHRWPNHEKLDAELERFRSLRVAVICNKDGSIAMATPVVDNFTMGVHFIKGSKDLLENAETILIQAAEKIHSTLNG